MLKRIIFSFLVILAVGFTFVSCDCDKRDTVPLVMPYNARTTPLSLENYGSSSMQVSITVYNQMANDSKLKYSIDGKAKISVSDTVNITLLAGETISFYDDRSNTSSASTYYIINCDAECYVYGNVMSLINSDNFKNLTSLENYECAFRSLFNENTMIENHPKKPLVLPATILSESCYSSMFYRCTGLTKAPDLPATTLEKHCYYNMFLNCTGLTEAPDFPATTLAEYCYYGMFNGCTGLTAAPDLPATTLADYCYYSMFQGCTGLTAAPDLPATTLADYCYYGMFQGCTGLTAAPDLPATTLAEYCYLGMFQGCTGLTAAPDLPATTLAEYCYQGMFQDCTGLTTAPDLPATTLAEYCYNNMFQGCTGLTAAPDLP
ncbi:MAG: hypothetical protein IJ836_08785, partial [Spirochaetales bacterium]|nr:hypothetical protein [Spirochaetales bacterium]